jgi:hypothetical protein
MGIFPLPVLWLWACSVLAQLFVLALLFLKRNSRKLPFFTAYLILNVFQAAFLLFVYSHPWGEPSTPATLAWMSECLTLLAQALATTEILEITLRQYQGIWGLGWRALTVASGLAVLIVTLAARSHWAVARWFEIDRGYHVTFALALVIYFLLVRYYSIPILHEYRMILGAFCFYSCSEIVFNTLLQLFFHTDLFVHQKGWQLLSLASFLAVQIVWLAALRKPLLVEDRQAGLLSDCESKRLSSQTDEGLRVLNEGLLRLLK